MLWMLSIIQVPRSKGSSLAKNQPQPHELTLHTSKSRACFYMLWGSMFKTVKKLHGNFIYWHLTKAAVVAVNDDRSVKVVLPCIRAEVDLYSMIKIHICSYISNSKIKKKSKNKISHSCQSHHLSFFKELFRSFSLFFWWICFGFLLHSHFLGLRCQYVKCFVQENHKGIKLAQGYNIQPSLNLCTLETQGQHIFMPVAWNICSLFFN